MNIKFKEWIQQICTKPCRKRNSAFEEFQGVKDVYKEIYKLIYLLKPFHKIVNTLFIKKFKGFSTQYRIIRGQQNCIKIMYFLFKKIVKYYNMILSCHFMFLALVLFCLIYSYNFYLR